MDEKHFLDHLVDWNNTLWGLPPGVMVMVFVGALATALRWWKIFPDRHIAPTCVGAGILAFCLLAPDSDLTWRVWLVKNIMVGFVISFISALLSLNFGYKLPFIGKYLPNGGPGKEDTTRIKRCENVGTTQTKGEIKP